MIEIPRQLVDMMNQFVAVVTLLQVPMVMHQLEIEWVQ